MKKIGCFRQDGQVFSGNITTLQFSVQARIARNTHKRVAGDPGYILLQTKSGSYQPEIGHAFRCVSNEDSIPYLKVEIDDPSCRQPIQASLWRAEDGLWYLFWTRPLSGQAENEELYVQEELKPPIGWHRAPQRMTAYLQELFPQLVL